ADAPGRGRVLRQTGSPEGVGASVTQKPAESPFCHQPRPDGLRRPVASTSTPRPPVEAVEATRVDGSGGDTMDGMPGKAPAAAGRGPGPGGGPGQPQRG